MPTTSHPTLMPWRNDPDARARSAATYGSPAYRQARDRARRRAGGRCEGCGHKHTRLQCDHIRNTGTGPPDHSLANLQMLCMGEGSCRCHERKTATEGGGFRKTAADPAVQPRTTW
ncbi:MAG TPA: hypothetical protein VIX86_21995 [Streptosporangiaceae bacterium]